MNEENKDIAEFPKVPEFNYKLEELILEGRDVYCIFNLIIDYLKEISPKITTLVEISGDLDKFNSELAEKVKEEISNIVKDDTLREPIRDILEKTDVLNVPIENFINNSDKLKNIEKDLSKAITDISSNTSIINGISTLIQTLNGEIVSIKNDIAKQNKEFQDAIDAINEKIKQPGAGEGGPGLGDIS